MKKLILSLFVVYSFNNIAHAVDMNTATTEDPKKAEETLATKDVAKKMSMEERRKVINNKHKLKKSAKAAKSVSGDNSSAKNGVSDVVSDIKRESKIQEHKEETAPKK